MGQEIEKSRFSAGEFEEFRARLRTETELLGRWFAEGRFDPGPPQAGFELEAWLVDEGLRPAPRNAEFIERLGSPLVSPELARFNVEFNIDPLPLGGDVLDRMAAGLGETWAHGRAVARELDCALVMIGILPTVSEADLSTANLSPLNRYRALNAEILRLREGRPLHLDIHGQALLQTEHADVMLESATTSFQLHLQTPPALARHAYNAAIAASAPLVAVSANSPYLFGRDLWAETRIPLFEQSVEVGGYAGAAHGPLHRVGFGTGYARHSLHEVFVENLEHFPVLLPVLFDEPPERLAHLRLHNGTLWRWNRPLIGFTRHADGNELPHLRIEHRVIPAGPSVLDEVANAAFFYGLVWQLAAEGEALIRQLPFATARDNFYAAARHGLHAHLSWGDAPHRPAGELLRETLLPLAAEGLAELGVGAAERSRYLGIIEQRVARGQNGASWQRAYCARHGDDMHALLAAYLARQESGLPVHEWEL